MRNLQLINTLDENFKSFFFWEIFWTCILLNHSKNNSSAAILFCIIKIFLVAVKRKRNTLKIGNKLVEEKVSLLIITCYTKRINYIPSKCAKLKLFTHDTTFYNRLTRFDKDLIIDIVYGNTNFLHINWTFRFSFRLLMRNLQLINRWKF